jgi:hypothetical protein
MQRESKFEVKIAVLKYTHKLYQSLELIRKPIFFIG